MSSNNNENLPTEQEQQQEEQQPQQLKNQTQEQKVTSWFKKSNLNTKSAGIDVIKQALAEEITVDQSKTQFYNLPTVPEYLAKEELIPTGTNDLKSLLQDLTSFFESCDLLQDKKFYSEGTNIHGSYHNDDLCAATRFSCYLYRTSDNEIAFNLHRVDGCGIAFARLFNALNQSLGSDKQRLIATFEAPQLLNLLQINALETHYTNLSQSNEDTCVFNHGIVSPISWSIQTLNNVCASMQKQHEKVLQQQFGASMDDIIIPNDEIIIPSDDNDEPIELPLPPKAQAHMITQSFDMLNSSLASIADVSQFAQTEPEEFSALTSFTESLFQQYTNGYTHLYALLNHVNLDVKISTLKFLVLVLPTRTDLILELPLELFSALYDEANQIVNTESTFCEPFQFINHQTLMAQIENLQATCFAATQQQ